MPINVGSRVPSHSTHSSTPVDRPAPSVKTPPASAAVRPPVDEFVASSGSNRSQQGPVISPDAITPPPGAGILGSTQEAQEAVRVPLSEALEPFREQLDQLASKIPPELKGNEGGLRQFIKEALEGLGIDNRYFPNAADYIQKVHSTNRDRITS